VSAARLLADLRARGVELTAERDRLRFKAPLGVITPELRRAMAERKVELLDLLDPARVVLGGYDHARPVSRSNVGSKYATCVNCGEKFYCGASRVVVLLCGVCHRRDLEVDWSAVAEAMSQSRRRSIEEAAFEARERELLGLAPDSDGEVDE
jgi:hypothetical protein